MTNLKWPQRGRIFVDEGIALQTPAVQLKNRRLEISTPGNPKNRGYVRELLSRLQVVRLTGLKHPKSFLFVYVFTLVLLLQLSAGCSQDFKGYKIDVTLQNAADTLFLRQYRDNKYLTVDSVIMKQGNASLTGNSSLKPGMYHIGNRQSVFIPFLISDTIHQEFSLQADLKNPGKTVVFIGSAENQAFAGFMRFMEDPKNRASGSQKQVVIRSKQDELLKNFPGTLLSLFIRTIREPEIPEPKIPIMITNREQALQEYYFRYIVNHFFDETDFSDSRLIRLPVWDEKLGYYFRQLVVPQPDTIRARIEQVVEKAKRNNEVYNYTVKFLYELFRVAPMTWSADVSNFIGENYIVNDSGKWKDPSFVNRVKGRVLKSKLNPVGFPATNLTLTTPSGGKTDLFSVSAPLTILYFFNPGCEACLPVTDELSKLYNAYKSKGIRIFAVYMDQKKEEWLSYIRTKNLDWIHGYDPAGSSTIEQKYDIYAMPMIYLLDKDKKVIVRDIQLPQLKQYLEN
jgi:thiol-disulfide isomerase/thioredoxin